MHDGIECALHRPGPVACGCPYHTFCRDPPVVTNTAVPELERRYSLKVAGSGSSNKGLMRVDELPASVHTVSIAERRISHFLAVLDLVYKCPWSNQVHLPNRQMVAPAPHPPLVRIHQHKLYR